MITVTSKKIDRVVVREGATATVVSKPRGTSLRIVQSSSQAPGDVQVTDLVAQYRLLSN